MKNYLKPKNILGDKYFFRITKWAHSWCDPILIALINPFVKHGITPNTLTIFGFLLSIIVAILILLDFNLYAGLVLIFAGLCDILDGLLAKVYKNESDLGAFLDSTIDQISDSLIFLSLGYIFIQSNEKMLALLTFSNLSGALIVSYIKAKALTLNVNCEVGPLGRFERIFILIICLIFNQIKFLTYFLFLFIHFTLTFRFIYSIRKLKNRNVEIIK